MEHYLAQMQLYRSAVPEPDVTLEKLRHVLYTFFDVKEQPRSDQETADKVRSFNAPIPNEEVREPSNVASGLRMTKEEADAWFAAGLPSPPHGWLRRYRSERR